MVLVVVSERPRRVHFPSSVRGLFAMFPRCFAANLARAAIMRSGISLDLVHDGPKRQADLFRSNRWPGPDESRAV